MSKYSVDSDLTSVWVHNNGECVARFGKFAFEIYSSSSPRVLAHRGPSKTVADWIDFSKAVGAIHGVEINVQDTPIRFRDELGLNPGYNHDAHLFHVPTQRLLKVGDPFESNIWGRGQVTRERVRECIETGQLEPRYVDMAARYHVDADWDNRRIAYLVLNPEDWPILVEVNDLEGNLELTDGWHRLAASAYREDEHILISASGVMEGLDAAFPDRIEFNADTDSSPAFAC